MEPLQAEGGMQAGADMLMFPAVQVSVNPGLLQGAGGAAAKAAKEPQACEDEGQSSKEE